MHYTDIYLGGTFDHFHAGHQYFLTEAAKHGTQLHVGITADHIAAHKRYRESMQPLADRRLSVEQFCSQNSISLETVTLEESFGPALHASAKNAALCVTTATEAGGNALNQARKALGLEPLPLIVVQLVPAADGQPIASERIRAGEISRDGTVYIELLLADISLTPVQREQLRKLPYTVVTEPVITTDNYLVGDSTVERFIEEKWPYKLAILDGYKQREEYIPLVIPQKDIDLTAVNPAHMLTAHLSKTLQLALRRGYRHIFVQGEEDLAAVALVLLAPLSHTVYFGVPDQGLAQMQVTEAGKAALVDLLKLKN